MAVEDADDDVVGERSFRCVHRWQRKQQSSSSAVEGATHKSSSGEGNCAWKLDLHIGPSATEDVSILRVDDRHSGRESNNAEATAAHEVGLIG
ncbi:hypothetical protein GW17_00050729 [Ensete ventricosum]|nr:hypothetical protein GW17_00050729 [Ensete ventricosum]